MNRRRATIAAVSGAVVVAAALVFSFISPFWPEPPTAAHRTIQFALHLGMMRIEHVGPIGEPPIRRADHDLIVVKFGAAPRELRNHIIRVGDVRRSHWVQVSLWFVMVVLLAYPAIRLVRSGPGHRLRAHLGRTRCAIIFGLGALTVVAVEVSVQSNDDFVSWGIESNDPPPAGRSLYLEIWYGLLTMDVTTTRSATTPQTAKTYSFGPVYVDFGDVSTLGSFGPIDCAPRMSAPPPPLSLVYPRKYSVMFPFWFVILALAAYPVIALARSAIRLLIRHRRGLCMTCGYDLTGNTTGVCPECFTKFEKDGGEIQPVGSCSTATEESTGAKARSM